MPKNLDSFNSNEAPLFPVEREQTHCRCSSITNSWYSRYKGTLWEGAILPKMLQLLVVVGLLVLVMMSTLLLLLLLQDLLLL